MKYLLIFLLLAFIGLAVVWSIVKSVFRTIFGEPQSSRRKRAGSSSRPKAGLDPDSGIRKKKVISKDEGEYIDYEDVKDE